MSSLKPKLAFTVGAKLISLIALLLVSSVISLVWISTRMFIEDNTALIQQMNADTAGSLALQMRELLDNSTEKMRVLGALLAQDSQAASRNPAFRESFAKDKDFLAIVLYKTEGGQTTLLGRAVSPEMENIGDGDASKTLQALSADKDFSIAQLAKGAVQLSSVKLPDGSAAVALGVPFITNESGGISHVLAALIRQSRFVKSFGESDIVTSFMVDSKGKLLAHTDVARVNAGENMAYLPVVKQLLDGKFNNGQSRYPDPQSNETRLGAFRVVGFGGLGVVSEVPEAKAFQAAQRVERRSIFVAIVILSVSFLAGYLYSGTITWPIKQLAAAARQISTGDFNINLRPKGHDEVAGLSVAFNEMARGLEERDRVKATFAKFHNKEIADKLLSGEVKLGGERREATIFFSDVRGFTGMSEAMQPEQVVEMLNEYMTRMVAIIRAHGGVVDKYVGDAIMALWGVPIGTGEDAFNAVRACVEMRLELARLNELRISRGQPVLKIGMGLNTGQVIAGNIGSDEKMEYTVIGDAVNLASRIESMTKEYGTDLLISTSVHERVKDKFVIEACKTARVKGKSSAIEVFKVRGVMDEQGNPILVETPYSTYAAEKSDKVVHDQQAASPQPVPPPFRGALTLAPPSVGPSEAPAASEVAEAAEEAEAKSSGSKLFRRPAA